MDHSDREHYLWWQNWQLENGDRKWKDKTAIYFYNIQFKLNYKKISDHPSQNQGRLHVTESTTSGGRTGN